MFVSDFVKAFSMYRSRDSTPSIYGRGREVQLSHDLSSSGKIFPENNVPSNEKVQERENVSRTGQ